MPSDTSAQTQTLHEIRGVLTKFMRMLFPLEFRIDSFADASPRLPFHYPLTAGEMIYLPERVEGFGRPDVARDYYFSVAAHLAGRHEFGTFELKLADLPGFDDRGEKGVEAIDGFLASFEDPWLAGSLMRLCESARIDAELCRRYRGLAPRVVRLNRTLLGGLPSRSLSTLLIRAALGDLRPWERGPDELVPQAMAFFEPLRARGADVLASARQTAALYQWLREISARISLAGPSDQDRGRYLPEDLLKMMGGADELAEGGEQSGDGDGSGEQNQDASLRASGKSDKRGDNRVLSPEQLRKLMEESGEINPSESSGEAQGEGIYVTQFSEKQAGELDQLREQLGELGKFDGHGRLVISRNRRDVYYAYDEWDYMLGDYRRNWCRVREIELEGDDGSFFAETLRRYYELLPVVRRHFQRIRPASYRMVRWLEDGEEIDLDRTTEMRVARLMGECPDGRVYKARKKEARDVATLFLLDMSASTDEPIRREKRPHAPDDGPDAWMKAWEPKSAHIQRPRRIIDVNKDALVIMAQALEELGDSYAIMGFSGHGRDNVEFYVIKEFDQELSDEVRARIGAVEPKRSTRMGAAIRHVREKFKDVSCRARHVMLLSDGFPQDFDYGHDRRSNAYGVQDTMVALKELELAGVLPFCITVDKTGHDYLRQMCQSSRYLVIEDIASLPMQLPKIYEQVVRW